MGAFGADKQVSARAEDKGLAVIATLAIAPALTANSSFADRLCMAFPILTRTTELLFARFFRDKWGRNMPTIR
ncbi:hypothetical protein [Rhodopseudomonas sp.]|uniref:hypothetical protein n=1 Tax=Rhodopseudomonas sp. TaxID=1078 RepID=UPI0039E28233